MIGQLSVFVLFALSVIATVIYFLSYKNKPGLKTTGRILYRIIAYGQILLSAYFLILIMNHNFEYTYVFSHSSREISGFLLASTFYAGQEGSFMLWTLLIGVIGLFLLPYTRKYGYESLVMGLYSLILVFLFLLLIFKSPFDYVWNTFADSNIAQGFVPKNGRGLNPILENFWMVIHPPILFAGYSSLSVPFTFALAGLIKKDFTNWIKVAKPWTLFATAIFGLGLALGSFWSYETLGWGGFWGWDPVENSSFLPWLVAIALVHTMKVQQATGGLARTNYFLSVLSFILVLYSTFLTRSGVLSDSSVHSFADAGGTVYFLLLLFMAAFLVLGIVIFIMRYKDIPVKSANFEITSKEFSMSIGALLLLAVALVTFIGVSAPIFRPLLGGSGEAIEISWYNNMNMPIMIVMLLILSLTIYLTWRVNNFKDFTRRLAISLILSVISTVVVVVAYHIENVEFILLTFASLLALIANLDIIFKIVFTKPRKIGAYLSHAGLAFLMLGIIALALNSKSGTIMLQEGSHKNLFGYDIKYVGKERIEKEKTDREKYLYHIQVTKNDKKEIVKPVFYWSSFNEYQTPYLEPGIKSYFGNDIYITTNNISINSNLPTAILKKESKIPMPLGNNDISLELTSFDMSGIMNNKEKNNFGAVIKVHKNDSTLTDTLFSTVAPQSQELIPTWKKIPGTNIYAGFLHFIQDPNNIALSQAEIGFSNEPDPTVKNTEVITIDFAIKPFISLVWIGLIAIVVGLIMPIRKPSKNLIAETK